ncbi:hypothetical protein Q0812_08535 [Brevundimonas sp. 2R-24]|uniref:Uncharacterized protein n=1 Tax=Peiella sedimenti TaxID=3061083 RepID=A0ABT8SNS4_9CAUL|nr:hypothetical protein [Caulobacteraceae bacterium XZ-24]
MTQSSSDKLSASEVSESIAVQGGDAMTGSGVGSDTRAGSLQGGAAHGSEIDPDQDAIDQDLKAQGESGAEPKSFKDAGGDTRNSRAAVNNVGQSNLGPKGDPAEGKRGLSDSGGDDVDAASG